MTQSVIFFANDGTNGVEPWVSDGTTSQLVKDVNPGSTGSGNGIPFVVLAGNTFFAANDGTHGVELWSTDGTSAGTHLFKDMLVGNGDSDPSNLTLFNGKLYFNGRDSAHNVQLWVTDGTAAGTQAVTAISGATDGLNPNNGIGGNLPFTVANGLMFFQGTDSNGTELWKSDGTAAGTQAVSSASSLGQIAASGNKVFFEAGLASEEDIWVTDGTPSGTFALTSGGPGSTTSSGQHPYLTDVNGTMFFVGKDASGAYRLWESNGTSLGTTIVSSTVKPGHGFPSVQHSPVAIGSTLYFSGSDGTSGYELWKTDGTTTTMISDIVAGATGSNPIYLTNVGGKLFFVANDGTNGNELWVSNGTTVTELTSFADIGAPASSPTVRSLTNVNGTLYFTAGVSGTGTYPNATYQVWTSDGTTGGTHAVSSFANTNAKPNFFSVVSAADTGTPVITPPGAQTALIGTPLAISGISIADSDQVAHGQIISVTLTATLGTISIGGGLTTGIYTNNSSSVTLTGSVADVNNDLLALTFNGSGAGTGSVSIDASDGILSATGRTITVNESVPQLTLTAASTVTLFDGNVAPLSGFVASDLTTSPAGPYGATVTGTLGTVSATAVAGTTVNGAGSGSMTITATTLAELNTDLAALTFTGAGIGTTGSVVVVVGDGTNPTATATTSGITVNDAPPAISAPAPLTAALGVSTQIAGLGIIDNDANAQSQTITVTLTGSSGTLSGLSSATNVTVTGGSASPYTVSGSLDAVNSELALLHFTGSNPSGGSITIQATDGVVAASSQTVTVSILPSGGTFTPPTVTGTPPHGAGATLTDLSTGTSTSHLTVDLSGIGTTEVNLPASGVGNALDLTYVKFNTGTATTPVVLFDLTGGANLILPGLPAGNSQAIEFVATSGNNSIVGGDTAVEIFGGSGADTISLGSGGGTVIGGTGTATIFGGSAGPATSVADPIDATGNVVIFGAAGGGSITAGGNGSIVEGGGGHETMAGGSILTSAGAQQVLYGSTIAGAVDTFQGNISGVSGATLYIEAGVGTSSVSGGGETDVVYGGSGAITIQGGTGVLEAVGHAGAMTVIQGLGITSIWGGTGALTVIGNNSNTNVMEVEGLDSSTASMNVTAGGGAMVAFGNAGTDQFSLGSLGGTIIGGTGNATMSGALGTPLFVAGTGTGADVFVIQHQTSVTGSPTVDIDGFRSGKDKLDLSGFSLTSSSITLPTMTVETETIDGVTVSVLDIALSNGQHVALVGLTTITAADLTASV